MLLNGQKRKELFRKLAGSPFQMKEGGSGIWRGEGKYPAREALSLFFAACPLAWYCLPFRGGESLHMYLVVIPWHGADGVQCTKGIHWDIGNCGESLRGELTAVPEYPLVGVIRPNWDGKEQVNNVCSSVLVHPQERELRKPWNWGRISRESAQ